MLNTPRCSVSSNSPPKSPNSPRPPVACVVQDSIHVGELPSLITPRCAGLSKKVCGQDTSVEGSPASPPPPTSSPKVTSPPVADVPCTSLPAFPRDSALEKPYFEHNVFPMRFGKDAMTIGTATPVPSRSAMFPPARSPYPSPSSNGRTASSASPLAAAPRSEAAAILPTHAATEILQPPMPAPWSDTLIALTTKMAISPAEAATAKCEDDATQPAVEASLSDPLGRDIFKVPSGGQRCRASFEQRGCVWDELSDLDHVLARCAKIVKLRPARSEKATCVMFHTCFRDLHWVMRRCERLQEFVMALEAYECNSCSEPGVLEDYGNLGTGIVVRHCLAQRLFGELTAPEHLDRCQVKQTTGTDSRESEPQGIFSGWFTSIVDSCAPRARETCCPGGDARDAHGRDQDPVVALLPPTVSPDSSRRPPYSNPVY